MATSNDKRLYQLTLAIQKAINSIETPVKEKHVRSTIIGTFQEQSALTYWMVACRLPLQDNRIVAWKFCHVTHKLLREGHPACLDDSQRHIPMIDNLGKLWVHLREGYGRLVSLYCTLLVTKLKFHARNPRFPGNMLLTADELDNIAENDVNNYFQLCVELFDYMDEILNLQAAVFDSLGNARANSMTASGQCRLAALIPCAQDSSHIYDCNVRLLFRLHAALPADTLTGHRERFRQQFKKLSQFYKHASSLQYYRNLLSLPLLPANPPNFLLQSDFGTYVTPVVSIPEPPPDEPDAVGSLIDTSDTCSQATSDNMDTFDSRTTPSPQPDPVLERDRLIDHLQNELKRMRAEVSQMVQDRNSMMSSMREHCKQLDTQLQAVKNELEEEKQKTEVLSSQTPEIQKKLKETEEKAKVTDEKFQKLKGAYTQLREEHITLIRQKAEVDKMATSLRAAAAQHESAKTALQQQLNDRMKDVELLQQSASSSEEIEAYKSEIASLRSELEQARQKEVELETLKASMEALEIEHKTASTEQHEQLTVVTSELKEVSENLEKVKHEKEEKEEELNRVKEELTGLKEKTGDEFRKVVEEKDAALKQVNELKQQYQQEKQEHDQCVNNMQAELKTLELTLTDVTFKFESQCTKLNDELNAKTRQLADSLKEKDEQIKEALDKLTNLQIESEVMKSNFEQKLEEKVAEITSLRQTITKLEQNVAEKNLAIQEFQENINVTMSKNEKQKVELENMQKENHINVKILNDKLETLTSCKDDTIKDLKRSVEEKDGQIISLNVAVNKLQAEVTKLSNELEETQAELEIAKNELMTMTEEHENMVRKNEANLTLKNEELRNLLTRIDQLSQEKSELINNIEKANSQHILEKEVFQSKIKELEDLLEDTNNNYDTRLKDIDVLNEELQKSKVMYENLLKTKETELQEFKAKLTEYEIKLDKEIVLKDNVISELEKKVEKLHVKLEELETLKIKEKQESDQIITNKDLEIQMVEARLEHTERKRLNAECELQDLLQHNSVLEADLATAKLQLEEAKKLVELQKSRLVSCAGEAGVEVTSGALAALERANGQDTHRLAAETAAQALQLLAASDETKNNEESVARSAILAAHNTAALSAYVTEVCNVSTDIELSDKLINDCRTMLSSTKQCLEALRDSKPCASFSEARSHIESVARAAASADRLGSGTKSVDDELADMDKAIEQAASQIEEMLAASKAGDSGVKLEVNGKILDACTTLMGAVKILVQDARKLQSELGDPKTRQKMYRRNPQWSEGLISAAKAVVFAAKLLVTSADEAVGASGRVEGVSAAAHEVAGSTAQLVAASRARAPPASPALARLTAASRSVAAATGAVVAAVRAGSQLVHEQEALDTSALTLTATRRLEMESKVRSLELESALDAERARLAALRKRHYHLAQLEENGNMTNGKQ